MNAWMIEEIREIVTEASERLRIHEKANELIDEGMDDEFMNGLL